jgi:ABC transporter substrate binding protein
MRRREFINLLGGAAAAWPLAARAQQSERMRRIGILVGLPANDPQGQATLATILQALQQLGWIDGRNVRIDYRWSGGNANDGRKYAAELVALAPDVMVATGGASVGPLLQAAKTIPVVCQKRQRPSSSQRQAPPRTCMTPLEITSAKLSASSSPSIVRSSASVMTRSVRCNFSVMLYIPLPNEAKNKVAHCQTEWAGSELKLRRRVERWWVK